MDNQKRTEWIDQYLMGELKEEELNQFRQQLQTDAYFRQEVEVQKSLFLQARKVGRDEMRQQLKDMHQRLNLHRTVERTLRTQQKKETKPILTRNRSRLFQYYAIAASITFLLVASFIIFNFYKGLRTNDIAQHSSAGTKSNKAHLYFIRLEESGEIQNFGFGGIDGKDTTFAVLIYPAEMGNRSYQFDDTLRLYGSFVPSRLTLRYNREKEQYILQEDSVLYTLQRYRAKQAL